MQKRPTWVTVVAVIGIIFSSFGILGAGSTMLMPKMMEFQKQMFSDIRVQMEKEYAQKGTSPQVEQSKQEAIAMFESMQKLWNFPKWFNTWSVITGLLQAIICGFYLFACIGLLQMKPSSIKMFYFAAGAKIAHSILNGIVGIMASSFMAMAMMFGSAFGIIFHIVLIIVVATADKTAFLPAQSQ
jgi:hypothetical protein